MYPGSQKGKRQPPSVDTGAVPCRELATGAIVAEKGAEKAGENTLSHAQEPWWAAQAEDS